MSKINYIKYNRTYHLPYSPCFTEDDKRLSNDEHFKNMDKVVCSIKMDGENCLKNDAVINTDKGDLTIGEIVSNKMDVKILSIREDGTKEFKEIENYIENSETDEWYEIELEDGTKLTVTGNHYIFLPAMNCYRRVCDLIEGDFVLLK